MCLKLYNGVLQQGCVSKVHEQQILAMRLEQLAIVLPKPNNHCNHPLQHNPPLRLPGAGRTARIRILLRCRPAPRSAARELDETAPSEASSCRRRRRWRGGGPAGVVRAHEARRVDLGPQREAGEERVEAVDHHGPSVLDLPPRQALVSFMLSSCQRREVERLVLPLHAAHAPQNPHLGL